MKRKNQPPTADRSDAVRSIEKVKTDMPKGCLSHISYRKLDEWHGILDRALQVLEVIEPLGVPDEVSYAKKLRLKIKETMAKHVELSAVG